MTFAEKVGMTGFQQVTHKEGESAMNYIGLGPAQDVHFFYTRSHSNALQSCALTLSTNFGLFSHLNSAQHNLAI